MSVCANALVPASVLFHCRILLLFALQHVSVIVLMIDHECTCVYLFVHIIVLYVYVCVCGIKGLARLAI